MATAEMKIRITPTNAPSDMIEFDFDGTQVTIPATHVCELLIAKLQRKLAVPLSTVPAIASPWPGQAGIYAGLVRGDKGEPDYHLIVAKGGCGELTWEDAGGYAAAIDVDGHRDFTLPKRKEQAVLFGNVPELFEKEWYWSSEQFAGDDASAWCQSFDYGTQTTSLKYYQLRARAVRRLIL